MLVGLKASKKIQQNKTNKFKHFVEIYINKMGARHKINSKTTFFDIALEF